MKNRKPFCIGIGGVAGSGKDTFFKKIVELFPDIRFKRIALADPLKEDLDGFLRSRFNISAFTTNKEEKQLIRPILVEYARIKRILTKGTYFTGLAQNKINECVLNDEVPIITDVRYCEYDADEAAWVINNNGFIIHVSRKINNEKVKPANEDELKNDKKVKKRAALKINWPSMENEDLNTWLASKKIKNKIEKLINIYASTN